LAGLPRAFWYGTAFLFLALGMRTKEVMVTAPLVVFLYDRIFLSASFGELFRRRLLVYLGMALVGGALTLPIIRSALPQGGGSGPTAGPRAPTPAAGQQVSLPSTGFGMSLVTPVEYAQSQPGIILHYLRLSFWPTRLCLDYAWPVTHSAAAAAPAAAVIALLLLATAWAGWRRPWLGFLGCWFFLILAPTSSFVPILDLAFEHRMYLSLAAPVVVVVMTAFALLEALGRRLSWGTAARERLALSLTAFTVLVLGTLTVLRNGVYRTPRSMWGDVVAKRPSNVRGRLALGMALANEGRLDDALEQYQQALRIKPDSPAAFNPPDRYVFARNVQAVAWLRKGEYAKAANGFRAIVRRVPSYANGQHNLGLTYALWSLDPEIGASAACLAACPLGMGPVSTAAPFVTGRAEQWAEAVQYFQRAVDLEPANPLFLYNLATALHEQGKPEEAARRYRQALRLAPLWPPQARRNAQLLARSPFRGDQANAVFLDIQARQAALVAKQTRPGM
jgi:tetratricopeptide (TPR) repeat protein